MKETTRGRCGMLETNQSVIRLRSQPKRHEMASVIAHEVFHLVTFIHKRVGMKLKLGASDESYAYMLGYLISEIHKKLKL